MVSLVSWHSAKLLHRPRRLIRLVCQYYKRKRVRKGNWRDSRPVQAPRPRTLVQTQRFALYCLLLATFGPSVYLTIPSYRWVRDAMLHAMCLTYAGPEREEVAITPGACHAVSGCEGMRGCGLQLPFYKPNGRSNRPRLSLLSSCLPCSSENKAPSQDRLARSPA